MAQENLYRELIFNNNGLKDPDEEVANPVNQGSIFDRLVGPAPADENPFYYQEPEYVEEPAPEPASQPAPATQSAPPAETVEPTTVEPTATQTETTGTGQKQPAPKPVEPLNFNVAEPPDTAFARRVEANRADDETEFYKGPRLFGFDSLSDLADAAMNIGVQTASAESTTPATNPLTAPDMSNYLSGWQRREQSMRNATARNTAMERANELVPYDYGGVVPADTNASLAYDNPVRRTGEYRAEAQTPEYNGLNINLRRYMENPAEGWQADYDFYFNQAASLGMSEADARAAAVEAADRDRDRAEEQMIRETTYRVLNADPLVNNVLQETGVNPMEEYKTLLPFVDKIKGFASDLAQDYSNYKGPTLNAFNQMVNDRITANNFENYDPRKTENPGVNGYREWQENRHDALQTEAQQRAYDLRVEREARRQDEMNYDPSVRNLLSGQAPETYTGSPNDISASTQNLLQEQSERDEQARIEQTRRNLARQRQAENLQAGLLEGSRLLDNPFARDAFDMLGNVSDIGKRLDMTRDIARDWSRQDLEARSKAGYQTFNYEDAINGQLDDDYAVPQVLTDEYGNTEYNGALNHLLNAYDIQYDANGNPITDEDGNVQKNYHYGDAHQLLALWARPDYINNPAAGLPQGDGAGFRELNLPEDVLNSGILASSQFTSADVARNGENVEYVDISKEDYDRLFDLFVGANPALRVLMDAGLLTDEDIAKFFFKMPRTEASKPRGSGGYGGGGRYYGGGGGYIGGGSYKPSVNLPTPTTAKQQQNRIYNIMKNWSF